MGVPFLFAHLLRHYPAAVGRTFPKRVDRGYVDFNSVVHDCARRAVTECHGHKSAEDVERAVIALSIDVLAELAAACGRLFVAADGVPPRAKTVQQRNRRYMSSVHADRGASALWNPCNVTPGTAFMRELDAAVRAWCSSFCSSCCSSSVVYSGSDEAGEGERKIFETIRASSPPSSHHLVCGLDADLIFMSLLVQGQHITIQRRDASSGEQYVNVDLLRKLLVCNIRCHDDKCVEDFVVLSMLLGNDFVPALPCLSIKHDAVNVLVELYRESVRECGERLVIDTDDDRKEVNFGLLKRVVQKVSDIEDVLVVKLEQHHADALQQQHQQGRRHNQGRHHHNSDPLQDAIAPSLSGWRGRYYAALFGSYHSSPCSHVHVFCEAYLEALAWCTQYYMHFSRAFASSTWHYPYAYAPTAQDLARFLHTWPHAEDPYARLGPVVSGCSDIELTEVEKGVLQLLTVLPPSASHLVPRPYDAIMTSPHAGCAHMYPKRFRTLSWFKFHDWEHVPVLPPLDVGLLRRAVVGLAADGGAN